jgi:hypothetical protein
MSNSPDPKELHDRLLLIESMIAEGRRKTRRWGWSFLLWGVAYYVAIAWSTLGHSAFAWPVTMITAILLTVALGRRTSVGAPSTSVGRSMGALWMAGGIALFVFGFCAAYSGYASTPILIADIEVILGLVNLASGIVLCWWMQQLCGYLWTGFAIATFFLPEQTAGYFFLAAIFLCNILFGLILMILEMRDCKAISASGSAHA